MKFEIVKKGYDIAQVDDYINKLNADTQQTLVAEKEVIMQLKAENATMSEKLKAYDDKKDEIFVAFVEAQELASRMKHKAEQRFDEEMERLKLFQQKWTNYAKTMMKTLTPTEAEKFEGMSKKFKDILNTYAKDIEVVQVQSSTKKVKSETKQFDPIKKVTKFLENFEHKENVKREVAAAAVATANRVDIEDEEMAQMKNEPWDAESFAEQMVSADELEHNDEFINQAVVFNMKDESKQKSEDDEEDDAVITQEEIIDVKQSLEDLCKELGILDE